MKEYIDRLIKNRVPLNSGYIYLATETIAIPVHKVTLGISKRHTTNLEIVEEMVLRFALIGINDIDMISGALGLPRYILDITIGDLHVKDLAFHSSGKCLLTGKGRDALKNLFISKREKDVIHNVYVNAVTGEICGEKNNDYIESRVHSDTIVKHRIDVNSIELFRRNMSSIGVIFEQAMKAFLDENMKIQDELVSIDSIDELFTGFIKAPIHIFVSENGSDIDIIACNKWQKSIIESHKEVIIEQMRTRKLLPNMFINKRIESPTPIDRSGLSCEDRYQLLKSLTSVESIEYFDDQARSILFGHRKLFENELLDLCKFVFSDAQIIEIQIDNLNYWSKNLMFLTIGSYITQKTQCKIFYRDSSEDIKSSIRRIRSSCPNIPEKNIQKVEHTVWLRIKIDSKIVIDTYFELIRVFTDTQYIPHIVAFVS